MPDPQPPTWTDSDRPRLAPALEFTPILQQGARMVVIGDGRGPYFQCTEAVAGVLRLFDGTRTLGDVRAEATLLMGQDVMEEDVRRLLRTMWSYGFLDGSTPLRRDPITWRRLLAFKLWEFETGGRFERFARLFAPLQASGASAFLLIAFTALAVLFVQAVIDNWSAIQMSMMLWVQWRYLLAYLGLLVVFSAVHECAHAIAYVNEGGRKPRFGVILLLGIFVAAYTDVSGAYRFPDKWRRIRVSLAGIFVNMAIAVPGFFLWSRLDGLAGEVVFLVAVVNGLMAVFSFFPSFRTDLYYVLVDLFETPNLHQRSVGYCWGRIQGAFRGGPPSSRPQDGGQRTLFVTYATVSTLAIVAGFWGLYLQAVAMSPATPYLIDTPFMAVPGAAYMAEQMQAMEGMDLRTMLAQGHAEMDMEDHMSTSPAATAPGPGMEHDHGPPPEAPLAECSSQANETATNESGCAG